MIKTYNLNHAIETLNNNTNIYKTAGDNYLRDFVMKLKKYNMLVELKHTIKKLEDEEYKKDCEFLDKEFNR